MQCSERNGKAVSICSVADSDDIIFITKNGIVIRVSATGISVIGRNTQGVTLFSVDEGDKVVSVARVVPEETKDEEGAEEVSNEEIKKIYPKENKILNEFQQKINKLPKNH